MPKSFAHAVEISMNEAMSILPGTTRYLSAARITLGLVLAASGAVSCGKSDNSSSAADAGEIGGSSCSVAGTKRCDGKWGYYCYANNTWSMGVDCTYFATRCDVASSTGLYPCVGAMNSPKAGCYAQQNGVSYCQEVDPGLECAPLGQSVATPTVMSSGCPSGPVMTCNRPDGTTVLFYQPASATTLALLCDGAPSAIVSRDAGVSTQPGQCPVWPRSKLLPIVGPLFYGPNPGPCTINSSNPSDPLSVSSSALSYDTQGRLASSLSTNGGLSMILVWNGDVLVSTGTDTYEWGSTYVKITSDSSVTRYELDAKGYPQSVTLTVLSSGETLGGSFEYENCRITRRTGNNGDGTIDMTYEYDASGRVAARRSGNGRVETYDYSCWGP